MTRDARYITLVKLTKKCKCGHSITLFNKKGYCVCDWRGRIVFANKMFETKYRQKEIIRKLSKDIKGD